MHQCAHHPVPDRYGRTFLIGILLNTVFVAVEAGYGYTTDSLALLADAGHNLSDVLGLLMAWAGYALAKLPPSPKYTYGWRGSSILAALFNSLLLLIAVGSISWEAITRLDKPESIDANAIIVVAFIGVIINTGTAILFAKGRKTDLNLRGAYLHMAADALLSLGVVVAGIAIHFTNYYWIDPAISILIALVILAGTWNLFRESIALAMQSVPRHINPNEVLQYLTDLPEVRQVHDLHIWAVSTTETALTVHLVIPIPQNNDSLLRDIRHELHDRFGICHSTIQIECSVIDADCGQADPSSL